MACELWGDRAPVDIGPESVVVVTGGAGCLGSHIVRLLMSKFVSGVDEIRVVDRLRSEVEPAMGLPEGPRVPHLVSIEGDIRDEALLRRAIRGASVVIHTCSVVDFGNVPHELIWSVNVDATRRIIEVCKDLGVSRLVYTSTMDVVSSWSAGKTENADESAPYPRQGDFLNGIYAESKAEAERLVLAASDGTLQPGHLVATAVRPLGIYGERDPYHIRSVLKAAKDGQLGAFFGDYLGRATARFAHIYAGNCAYAHLVAAEATRLKPGVVSGRAFFFCDDSPTVNFLHFFEVYLKQAGYRMPRLWLPNWFGYLVGFCMEAAERLLRPCRGKRTVLLTRTSVAAVTTTQTFSDRRARSELGYSPIFSYAEAERNSLLWFKAHPVQ